RSVVSLMSRPYWCGPAEDEAMQEEHAFIWEAMLDTIDIDLAGKRVLDAGCNRGGFLRLLTDSCAIAEGFGYDQAMGAVEDARRLAGDRPLRFEVSDAVPTGCSGFDLVFSHEVLYLLHDLDAHAREIFAALSPGGVYYAVIGVHAASPLMAEWHRGNAEELHLPEPYDIDEVIAAFERAGFDGAAARLAVRFVPAATHGHHSRGKMLEWLDYYSNQKRKLRWRRPV